ncbi:MAG: alanine racemase [Planctomycetota bacterium]
MKPSSHSYDQLKDLVTGETLPVMLVDLDAFDRNVEHFLKIARNHEKLLRPASKSVRVPALLHRLQELGGETVCGLMCYSTAEAVFLADHGFDDLLVAYPHVQPADVQNALKITEQSKSITLMVDSHSQVERLAKLCSDNPQATPLRVCIDIDASLKTLGQHMGVQRSSLRSIGDLKELIRAINDSPQLKLVGAMTYEAQVAGLGDCSPHQRMLNPIIRRIKRASMDWLKDFRQQVRQVFADEGVEMEIFNGGGSGSFEHTATHTSLTEVTAGSGFLQSHLFDHYALNQCEPAIFFGLAATRIPQPDRLTCHSGGFIASGSPGADRQPTIYQPEGLSVDSREGYGEVQTPLIVPRHLQGKIHVGDPIFFRPAKAGEIAERFDEYILFRGDKIVDRVPTYRGLSRCFY